MRASLTLQRDALVILVLVQSVSINFTYSSPGLLVGGRLRSNLALDDSERLKRKRNKKFYVKNYH